MKFSKFWKLCSSLSSVKFILLAVMAILTYLSINSAIVPRCNKYNHFCWSEKQAYDTHTLGRSIENKTHQNATEVPTVEFTPRKTWDACSVTYLAFSCFSRKETLELFWSVKSLLYFRTTPLHITIFVDETSHYVLRNLFDSWNLPCVEVNLHKSESKKYYDSHVVIPNSQQRAIFLSNKKRFMSDIKELYQEFSSLSPEDQEKFYIPQEWRTDVNSMNTETPRPLKAFAYEPDESKFLVKNSQGNNQIELLHEILNLNGDLFSHTVTSIWKSNCTCLAQRLSPPSRVNTKVYSHPRLKDCQEYVHYAAASKRVFLYFHGNRNLVYTDFNDISLVTQLTVDRWSVLLHMIKNWEGPMVVVLYVTDADVRKLQGLVSAKVLKQRRNIDIHLIFKKKHLYPINEIRNLGIREVRTPYTLFLDVDLLPNPTIYQDLKNYVKQYFVDNSGLIALIVPAFEAFEDLKIFPTNKSMLVDYMKVNKVSGYKMWRGWNLGHKPTNYPKWMTTNSSYQVKWRDAYEPYVVIQSKHMPHYEAVLLERMGDKIAYGLEMYARGYNFYVLHDQFIVHIPHPKSHSTSLWSTDARYARCSGRLFQAYKENVFRRYPDKKY